MNLDLEQRKQRLVIACMADRAAWVDACAPRPPEPLAMAGRVLKMIAPFAGLLPGRIGRWLRNAQFLTKVGRQLGNFL